MKEQNKKLNTGITKVTKFYHNFRISIKFN